MRLFRISCLLVLAGFLKSPEATAQDRFKLIYFNLYTDSIKPILNYYVNVEGQTVDGRYMPLDDRQILLTADWGELRGNEWVIPKTMLHDSVTFTAVLRSNPVLREQITVWVKKWKDPRDEPGYEEPGSGAALPAPQRRGNDPFRNR
ncbi:MAG: hypothetical protein EOP52_07465 [Sphingobacteriales bacterium]|nr:MAG: hypothetical protein EOP52_07465 [Sphingobacteriales bacterium]